MAGPKDNVRSQFQALGAFIRTQRHLANLSLRELAARTEISNPYLSQIERGLHEPSVRVLKSLANALNVSAETLLAQAGLLEGEDGKPAVEPSISTEAAIRADVALSEEQKKALLGVYRSYVSANRAAS
jgi:transcriptional regulator with XRE-family HTH domain